MKKLIFGFGLLSLLNLQNYSLAMEEEESITTGFDKIPLELRLHIIESRIQEEVNINLDPIDAIIASLKYITIVTSLNQDLYSSKQYLLNKLINLMRVKFTLELVRDKDALNEKLLDAIKSTDRNLIIEALIAGATLSLNSYPIILSPLIFAIKDESINLAQLLSGIRMDKALENSLTSSIVNVDLKDAIGDTALIRAAQAGQIEVVKLLIKLGAKVDLKNALGETALMRASQRGQTEIAALLIKNKANLNLRDNDGNTALMSALYGAMSGYMMAKIVELLIKEGADDTIANNHNQTALNIAENDNKLDVIRLLSNI